MNLLFCIFTFAIQSWAAHPNQMILIGSVKDFDQNKVTLQIQERKIRIPRKSISEKNIRPEQVVKARLTFKELKAINR